MSGRTDTPPVVAGFFEGLVAPLLELIASVMIAAAFTISETLGGTPWYLIAIVAIIVLIDFARNILLGLSHTQFALGNLIGNIIGIIIFYAAVNSVSQEAATQSLLLTIALAASYGLGVFLYLRSGR